MKENCQITSAFRDYIDTCFKVMLKCVATLWITWPCSDGRPGLLTLRLLVYSFGGYVKNIVIFSNIDITTALITINVGMLRVGFELD